MNKKEKKKGLAFLLNLDEFLGYITLTVVVAFTALNVILRYFFKFTISSAEEITLIAFIWASYLGCAAAYKSEEHIAIDILVNQFPEKVKHVYEIALGVFLVALNGAYLYYSIILCINVGNKSTTVMSLPYIFIDLSLAVCFGLMLFYSLIKLVRSIRGQTLVLHETGILDPANMDVT